MKRIMILIDGLADEPCSELKNKTPLEVAQKKHLQSLANKARLGKVQSVPKSFQAMTEIGTLSLLGYAEEFIPKGRGYFEAIAHGVIPKTNQTAFRCSFIHHDNGKISTHAVDNLKTSEAKNLIETLNKELKNNVIQLHLGKNYQHIALIEASEPENAYPSPLDLIDLTQTKPFPDCLPEQTSLQKTIKQFIQKANNLLESHPINHKRKEKGIKTANGIHLWSPSLGVKLPTLNELYKIKNTAVITATPIIKGIASAIGMDFLSVKGANGTPHTNYEAKGAAMLKAIEQYDFVLVHIEACDEAAHQLNPKLKAQCIEQIDQHILGKTINLLHQNQDIRLAIAVDHGTSSRTGKHLDTPTPFLIVPNTFGINTGFEFTDRMATTAPIHAKQFAKLFFSNQINSDHHKITYLCK